MYAGNIGFSQGLDVILETARILSGNSEILFAIIGEGTTKSELMQKAHSMNLKNIVFLPVQPMANLPFMLASADVSLVVQKGNVLDINLPSKIPGIMASGRPMIAAVNPNGDAAGIVKEADCGFLIQPENPSAMSEKILELYGDAQMCKRFGMNGRNYALRHFTAGNAVNSYFNSIKNAYELHKC